MSYTSKFVAAVIGLLVMAVVVSRQLFLFTVSEIHWAWIHREEGTICG